jgi:hypothetical protein
MAVYVSVGTLFHITTADHTDSCTDSLVQLLLHATNTKHTLVPEQSLYNINTEFFSFIMSYSILFYKKGKFTGRSCHVFVPSTTSGTPTYL